MSLRTVSQGVSEGVPEECPKRDKLAWSPNRKKPGEHDRTLGHAVPDARSTAMCRTVGTGCRVVVLGTGWVHCVPGTGSLATGSLATRTLATGSLATRTLATGTRATGHWDTGFSCRDTVFSCRDTVFGFIGFRESSNSLCQSVSLSLAHTAGVYKPIISLNSAKTD